MVPERTQVTDYLEQQGVQVSHAGPFDPRSPHCNKIASALTLAEIGWSDSRLVLTDTDIAFLADPRRIAPVRGGVAGKVVDRPNPPLHILKGVFDAAGLPLPEPVELDWFPSMRTVLSNLNGGLYVISSDDIAHVAATWAMWARWLLGHRELLGRWTLHVDQVAFALCLVDLGLHVERLDPAWNLATHHPEWIPEDVNHPHIIHYHRHVRDSGLLRPTGNPVVDHSIDRVNQVVSRLFREFFPNATFWSWRYQTNPELGSGIGSRGVALEGKRRLIAEVLEAVDPRSVIDVGCGDGEAMRGQSVPSYTGVDASPAAIELATRVIPEGHFVVGGIESIDHGADLVVCLDVLIHQADSRAYRRLVSDLVERAQLALLVSGYEAEPSSTSPMVHFHEPLSESLRSCREELEMYPVRVEHEITTFLVLKPPVLRHPRDVDCQLIDELVPRHGDPLALASIRLVGWHTIGFFPHHGPRLWEYPAAATFIRRNVQPHGSILDVGAGVNPLVPYLTKLGYEVDTVDPSPRVREWSERETWNEWGYFDYAAAGLARRSWNSLLEETDLTCCYDLIYSVSVIEHLRSGVRQLLLEAMHQRLQRGGFLVLTVDLVKGTNALWNRSEGVKVEPADTHGCIDDVVAEAESIGLELVEMKTIREWSKDPVDIGWLVFRNPG